MRRPHRDRLAVFLFDRLVGGIFIAPAAAIAIGRVVTGVHYPADVVAGALVGAAAALLIVRLARLAVARIVGALERLTDPVVALVWRFAPGGPKPATD